MLFEEDGFLFDPEDGEEQLTIIEEEKLKIIENMEKYLQELKNNVKFKESQCEAATFQILANGIDQFIKLNQLEANGATEEEIFKAIKEINLSQDELTFDNMDEYAQDFQEINGMDELTEDTIVPREAPDIDDEEFDF